MTLSVHPGGALPPPPTPLPLIPPLPPSAPAAARRRANWSARTLSVAALVFVSVGAAAFGGSTFLGLSFSIGGGALTGFGGSLTTSFFTGSVCFRGVGLIGWGASFTTSFFGDSFSTSFFLMAISAASSFTSVLTSGVTGVCTCWLASHSSTSTPEGVELFQLIPITRNASNPTCTISEKVKARLVLSCLVRRPRLNGDKDVWKVGALFIGNSN